MHIFANIVGTPKEGNMLEETFLRFFGYLFVLFFFSLFVLVFFNTYLGRTPKGGGGL